MSESVELVQTEDAFGRPAEIMTREEANALNVVTPNVVVFVRDPHGCVWLHRRSMDKAHLPGLWDVSACGGVHAGEVPASAARRELREELGLDCDLTFITTFLNVFTVDLRSLRRRSHVFVGVTAGHPILGPEVEAALPVALTDVDLWLSAAPELFVPSFAAELHHARLSVE